MIREELYNALVKSSLPCFYITKKNSKAKEYLIFSYTEILNKIVEGKEDLNKINVFVNVYTKDDNQEIKNKIVQAMEEIGFVKRQTPNAMYDESLDVFNSSLQFQGLRERKEG